MTRIEFEDFQNQPDFNNGNNLGAESASPAYFASALNVLRLERDRINNNLQLHLQPIEFIAGDTIAASNATDVDACAGSLDPQLREQLWIIANNPSMSGAFQQLRQMLSGNGEDRQALTATALLSLLASSNPEDVRAGQLLLSMLNDPQQRETARSVLAMTGPFNNDLLNLAHVLSDPALREATNEIAALINSGNSQQAQAGANLARLIMSGQEGAPLSQTLIGMLRDPNQRHAALNILRAVSDTKQIQIIVNMLQDPAQRNAANELLRLLSSQDTASGAHHFLQLATSTHQRDRSDAQRYQSMLNSANEADRQIAARILMASLDQEQRHQLLDLWHNASTRPLAQRLLDLSESSQTGHRAVAEFLSIVGSTNASEHDTASRLIPLLQGSDREQSAAETILTRLTDNNQRKQTLSWLGNHTTRDGAFAVLDLLNGNLQQRLAANRLLEIGASRIATPESTNRLLALLGNQQTRTDALTILSRVSNLQQINEVVDLMFDPRQKAAGQELLKLLSSPHPDDQLAANNLLSLLRPRGGGLTPDDRARETQGRSAEGQELLQMLADPNRRELARTLLLHVPNQNNLRQCLRAINDPRAASSARAVVEMLNHSDTRQTAIAVINAAEKPADVEVLLEIARRPAVAAGLRQLNELSDGPQSHSQLLRLLASRNEEAQRAGQNILSMLGRHDTTDPAHNRYVARDLLAASLSTAQVTSLHRLLSNGATQQSGLHLLAILQEQTDKQASINVARVLDMLSSQDGARRNIAQSVVDMLCNDQTVNHSLAMLRNLRNENDFARLVSALNNQAEGAGAQELLRLMALPRTADNELVPVSTLILNMLTGPDAQGRQVGDRLLRMLGDPQLAQRAVRLAETFANPQEIQAYFRMTESPDASAQQVAIGRQLQDMLNSPDASIRRGARNFLALPSQQSREILGRMLSNPNEQLDARAILTGLTSPVHCANLANALNNPNRRAGAQVVVEMLRSGNSSQVEAARNIMTVVTEQAQGRLAGNLSMSPLSLLADRATRNLARGLFNFAGTPDGIVDMANLLTDPNNRQYCEQLLAMANDAQQAQTARNILDRVLNVERYRAILQLLRDDRQQGEMLLSMLASENNTESRAASHVLLLLGSSTPEESAIARRFLPLLSNPEHRELAQGALARLSIQEQLTLLEVIEQGRSRHALETITDLLTAGDNPATNTANRTTVQTLLRMLSSQDPSISNEGRRLLNLLNQPEHQSAALRLLRQRVNTVRTQ